MWQTESLDTDKPACLTVLGMQVAQNTGNKRFLRLRSNAAKHTCIGSLGCLSPDLPLT